MTSAFINEEAVLRIGEVCEVSGRTVSVLVDKNKNLSDLFFHGKVLKNVSVGSFIEIKKGFMSLIAKVETEKIVEEKFLSGSGSDSLRYRRYLTATLTGYVDRYGRFTGGTRELPLIGNEAFILTEDTLHLIHCIAGTARNGLQFSRTDLEDIDITLPLSGLLNSHIAIFGNTGSGKSNTLAALYQHGYAALAKLLGGGFKNQARFMLLDFNGEYGWDECITRDKVVYNLNTHHEGGDRIPMPADVLLEHEILSVLTDATDKTQKPFLKRVLDFRRYVEAKEQPQAYFRGILTRRVTETLFGCDKKKSDDLIDLFRPILRDEDLIADIDFYFKDGVWRTKGGIYFTTEDKTQQCNMYRKAAEYRFPDDIMEELLDYMYLQLINEYLSSRSNPEHISPVINRMRGIRKDIRKIFDTTVGADLWAVTNFIVLNLNMVNLTMKKTLPLMMAKWAYSQKKMNQTPSSLHLIIDEAHNILSSASFRESESWKDYRLETFEEIIKEGRKFGVFVTISSQRPNDISPTIISQAHNYFIHRLINQNDLYAIEKSVSYIDRLTEESIPTLATGTCIFSGVICPMPLKLRIAELHHNEKPRSHTLTFEELARLNMPPLP
ncbi:ATP-binding protein [Escherichia coli]|uniref:ATP-binding protein n=1 Tax=Escherichia coli TaxID=562 RepID=UPI0023F82564|nr:ATP-binding protein [Escherichia coli]ELU5571507.1 ATP-binding protein [Escherichia coli]EMB1337524.1 ATP-binding protein [Escherichia coli]MDF7600482.1 ATP-binding protein [Escherichia coli]MDF7606172.1 ATP-binding protein [Escherichia coli]MDF7620573.1 ATP-binding protein [Escherichia coli]